MTQVAVATGLIVTLILTLSLIVIAARAVLSPARPVVVTVNGDHDIDGMTGVKLLTLLNDAGIPVPSACAGAGTCGQCKVRLRDGGGDPLPTEIARLSRSDLRAGQRLSCQVTVRDALSVEVAKDILSAQSWISTVISTRQLAPLIRELVLSVPETVRFDFRAGSYIQVDAPAFDLDLNDFNVADEYARAWVELGVQKFHAHNRDVTHRAYSVANRPQDVGRIVLNIRLALPPLGADDVPPGIVSSYLFSLKPGNTLGISGPYGDFHVQSTEKEMIFIGGGVGMAPLRAMVHEQLAQATTRKVSFWYGARSGHDLFYEDEFEALAKKHSNFTWTPALSEPRSDDNWDGPTGFIHDVVYRAYIKDHPAPHDCEYYLCGPPLMIAAVLAMLDDNGVEPTSIFNDDFGI